MSKKSNIHLFVFTGALLCMANSANAIVVYDNNISALNINMLTDTFMSYTNYGEKMADLFENRVMYGSMSRFDEYGDDGTTVKNYGLQKQSNNTFIKDIWANANHVNGNIHYGNNISAHGRFNLATLGANTKPIDLKYGRLSFGAFASYINSKITDTKSNGDVVGIFTHYKYRNFGARTLTNIGSLNNNSGNSDYNNSWFNVATDAYANLKIDETLYFKPSVYVGYTWVSSDDLYINGNHIYSSDFNFFNIAPGISFIKEIAHNWYGTFSAKYVAHFMGNDDIHVGNTTIDGLDIDNHTDVGIDLEYNLKHFVIGGKVHKQMGGIDGWNSHINVKYVF